MSSVDRSASTIADWVDRVAAHDPAPVDAALDVWRRVLAFEHRVLAFERWCDHLKTTRLGLT